MLEYLFSHISYLGIIFILVLTGIGIPIPEELPVVVAGAASAYGQLNPWLAFLACVIGALGGDLVMYTMGYHFGHGALKDRPLFARFLSSEREARVERMILQHGLKVLVVARFMVGLRSAAYLAAGILRLPLRRFLLVDSFCVLLVVGVTFGLSYRYARSVEDVLAWLSGFGMTFTISVLAIVAVVALVYWRRRKNRLARILQRRVSRANRQRPASTASNGTLPKSAGGAMVNESETMA